MCVREKDAYGRHIVGLYCHAIFTKDYAGVAILGGKELPCKIKNKKKIQGFRILVDFFILFHFFCWVISRAYPNIKFCPQPITCYSDFERFTLLGRQLRCLPLSQTILWALVSLINEFRSLLREILSDHRNGFHHKRCACLIDFEGKVK